MKRCAQCGEEKEASSFNKRSSSKDGLRSACRTCELAKQKDYYQRNSEMRKKRSLEYYRDNKDYYKAKFAERLVDEEKSTIDKARKKKWKQENKDKVAEQKRRHAAKHRAKLNLYKNNYNKRRCATDPTYKAARWARNNVYRAMKNKNVTTLDIVGCSFDELRKHIEAQFLPGMTWDNHGRGRGCWHIDHIIPLCKFSESEMRLANHYTNLAPLWEHDNLSKGGRFTATDLDPHVSLW